MPLESPIIHDAKDWIDLVWRVVNDVRRHGEDRLELLSVGAVGLLKASKTWDEFGEATFMTYAYKAIRYEIWHHRTRERNYRKCINGYSWELAQWAKDRGPRRLIMFSEFGSDYVRGKSHEFAQVMPDHETCDDKDHCQFVLRLLESDRQRRVVVLRYILGHTLKEVAEYLGVTLERVRQIEVRAIRKIKDRLHTLKMAANAKGE